jgi:hypothetical protein
MAKQNNRNLFHAEFARGKNSGMTSDDVIFGSDQNGIRPTELQDRSCNGGDLGRAVRARGLFARGIRRSIGQCSI